MCRPLRFTDRGVLLPRHTSSVAAADEIIRSWVESNMQPSEYAAKQGSSSSNMLAPIILAAVAQLAGAASLVNADVIVGSALRRRSASAVSSLQAQSKAVTQHMRLLFSIVAFCAGVCILWLLAHPAQYPTLFCPWIGYCD